MSKKGASESKDNCAACCKSVGDENWLSCNICDKWFHAKCMNIKEDAYKVLQQIESCHWFLRSCNQGIGKVIPTLMSLNEKLGTLENKITNADIHIEKVKDDVKAVSSELNKVKAVVEDQLSKNNNEISLLKQKVDKINEQLDQHPVNFNEIVKQQVSESLEAVNDNIQVVQTTIQETRAQAAEQRDKENRRNNIILYKVPESDAARAEDRNKADVTFCLNLFNRGLQAGIAEDDLVNVFRLGRRDQSNSVASRPLMVQLTSYTFKNLIMESLYRLRHAEQKYKDVIIAHEMTRTERDECKRLVELAKATAAQDTSGEFLYRVRGSPADLKIVKIKKRN